MGFTAISNVLGETKQQQVIVLERLGWSLRCIEGATGRRREMVRGSLKAAGCASRARRSPHAQHMTAHHALYMHREHLVHRMRGTSAGVWILRRTQPFCRGMRQCAETTLRWAVSRLTAPI